MNTRPETLIPVIGVITDVRLDTPHIKTFRVVSPDGKKAILDYQLIKYDRKWYVKLLEFIKY